MPTYLPHLKLEIGGTLGTPALDIWSNTVRFKLEDDDDPEVGSQLPGPDQLAAALFVMGPEIIAWWANTDGAIGAGASITYAKFNAILATGKQRDVATVRIEFPPQTGPLGSNLPPWYQTVALTMRTEKSRGRAHSGRIYPPTICLGMPQASPYMSAPTAGLMAANFAAALDRWSSKIATIGSPTTTECYPVIASPLTTIGPNPGPALLQRVTGVVCDRVPDVQHRRTNRVPRLEGTLAPVAGA